MYKGKFVNLGKMAKKKNYKVFRSIYREFFNGGMSQEGILVISKQYDKGAISLITDNYLITSNNKRICINEGTLRKTFYIKEKEVLYDVLGNEVISLEKFVNNPISESKHFSNFDNFVEEYFSQPLC